MLISMDFDSIFFSCSDSKTETILKYLNKIGSRMTTDAQMKKVRFCVILILRNSWCIPAEPNRFSGLFFFNFATF